VRSAPVSGRCLGTRPKGAGGAHGLGEASQGLVPPVKVSSRYRDETTFILVRPFGRGRLQRCTVFSIPDRTFRNENGITGGRRHPDLATPASIPARSAVSSASVASSAPGRAVPARTASGFADQALSAGKRRSSRKKILTFGSYSRLRSMRPWESARRSKCLGRTDSRDRMDHYRSTMAAEG
jgi:hypothetical protein